MCNCYYVQIVSVVICMFKVSREDVSGALDELYRIHGSELFGDYLEDVRSASESILYQVYLKKKNATIHKTSVGCVARAVLYMADDEVEGSGFGHNSYKDFADLKLNNGNTCSKNKIFDTCKLMKGKIDKFTTSDLIDKAFIE